MTLAVIASLALASYLVGAVPFGYLVARWRGVDILRQGSGNIGATNVGRVLGRRFGALVFLLDFAKGALPVLAGRLWPAGGLDLPADALTAAAGVSAFLGHLFPVYLGFRGGKGVATGAGVVTLLVPGPTLAALLAWVVVALCSRYVSLASLTAAAVLCLFRFILTPEPWAPAHRVVTLFCLVAAALIAVRHRANVGRLLAGHENRLKEAPAMSHLVKTLHVLALGLWFGTVVFFTFVVGFALFGTFEAEAVKPKSASPRELGRPVWFPAIQAVCGLLALATALAWCRPGAGRVHRVRAGILAAALVTVALGWWLDRVVEDLRLPRNNTFDTMVSHSPPAEADVRAAVEARQTFVRWHLYSIGVNMLTVLLVTVAMAQAARLPEPAREPQRTGGKEEPAHAAVPS
jgi:acyl phosphate:glycerol-3-phosphate acyltransferase